jgi:hypothetical protein
MHSSLGLASSPGLRRGRGFSTRPDKYLKVISCRCPQNWVWPSLVIYRPPTNRADVCLLPFPPVSLSGLCYHIAVLDGRRFASDSLGHKEGFTRRERREQQSGEKDWQYSGRIRQARRTRRVAREYCYVTCATVLNLCSTLLRHTGICTYIAYQNRCIGGTGWIWLTVLR